MHVHRPVWFEPSLFVHHDEPIAAFDSRSARRSLAYDRGCGQVMRMWRFPRSSVAAALAKPLLGAILSTARGDLGVAHFRLNAFRGRLQGYRAAPLAPALQTDPVRR